MNAMDRLDDLLVDVDDLLLQADNQTIDECLEGKKAADHVEVDITCPSCDHAFHGLACHPAPRFVSSRNGWHHGINDYAMELTEPGANHWPCTCETSLPR